MIEEAIQKERALIIQDSERSKVTELETLIINALQGRPLPIRLSPCEQILEVAGYAKAEAGNVYHQSKYVREPARARLAMLGLNTNNN